MSFNAWLKSWKSPRAQLWLMAGAGAGAILLAVAALCLRTVLFEPYIRDQFPVASERVKRLLRDDIASVNADADVSQKLEDLSDTDVEALCGELIRGEPETRSERVMQALWKQHGEVVWHRARRACLVGNRRERAGAIALLGEAPLEFRPDETVALCERARVQALRRGEAELVEAAVQFLTKRQRNQGFSTPARKGIGT